MKTLTEFDGFRLKAALATKAELVKAGKTPEELPAALGEALKLEGDKLALMTAALEVAETKADNLKRVVVYTLAEGEKAPSGAVQKGEQWFLAEFFFAAQPKGREHGREGGRDGGKRGRGKGRGGKGGRDGGRGGERGDRKPRDAGAGGGGGDRKPRPARGPRPEGGGKPNVKPNVTPVNQAASAEKKPEAAASGETPSS